MELTVARGCSVDADSLPLIGISVTLQPPQRGHWRQWACNWALGSGDGIRDGFRVRTSTAAVTLLGLTLAVTVGAMGASDGR